MDNEARTPPARPGSPTPTPTPTPTPRRWSSPPPADSLAAELVRLVPDLRAPSSAHTAGRRVVFDRGGGSPATFAAITAAGLDVLTRRPRPARAQPSHYAAKAAVEAARVAAESRATPASSRCAESAPTPDCSTSNAN